MFCPRYRRKIFNIEGLEQRFKELTEAECSCCGLRNKNPIALAAGVPMISLVERNIVNAEN